MKCKQSVAIVIFVILSTVGVWIAFPEQAQSKAIRVGYMPIGTPDASAVLEVGKEIADMLEIDSNLIPFQSGPAMISAYVSGELDVGIIGEAPFLSLVNRAPGKFISINSALNSYFLQGLVAGKDTPYKNISDLKGKKLAVPVGSATHLWIQNLIRTCNMTEKDVNIVNMAAKDAVPALKAGQIDGFAWAVVVGVQAELEGWGRIINFTGDATGPGVFSNGMFMCNNHVAAKEFMDKYPKLLQAWEDIYIVAMQFMMEHPVATGVRWAKEGGVPAEVYVNAFPCLAPYPYVDANYYGMLDNMAAFLKKATLPDLPTDLTPFIDGAAASISRKKGIAFRFPSPLYKTRNYLPGVKYDWGERDIPIKTLLKPYVDELKAKRIGELN